MNKRDFNRTDRINEAIGQALSVIIQQQMNDPRIGMLTIEAVEVSKDISHAKVFVSVLNADHSEQTLEALNQAAGFIRQQLSQQLELRQTPKLRFIYDDTSHQAAKLTALIKKARARDNDADID